MSKGVKIWLIVAASLVLLGAVVFTVAMVALNWNFTNLSTGKYQTNSYEIDEEFISVSINTDTADITLVPSGDAKCSVVCYERENEKHSVAVKDGALAIELNDTRKWYEYIGLFNFDSPKVTVYIPAGEYGTLTVVSDTGDVEIPKELRFESIDITESTGDVKSYASATGAIKIKTSTGKVFLENLSAASLDISVSTGKVTASAITCEGDVSVRVTTGKAYLADVTCRSLISNGSTGDIFLRNVVASERFSIERSTGDVEFEGSDAAEIVIVTDTGDVEGSLLSDKVFMVDTDTGDVEVPRTTTGGRCEITTDTGDVEIIVK